MSENQESGQQGKRYEKMGCASNILLAFGILFLLFGLVGLLSTASTENHSKIGGYVAAFLFISIGSGFIYKVRKSNPEQADKLSPSIKNSQPPHLPISKYQSKSIPKHKSKSTCGICSTKIYSLFGPEISIINFTNKDPIFDFLCIKCAKKQPNGWKDLYKDAVNKKQYDRQQRIRDFIVAGKIADKLESKHGVFEYKGGHPDFSTFTRAGLIDTAEGIVVFSPKYSLLEGNQIYFTIKWENIAGISADSETITTASKAGGLLMAAGMLSGRSGAMITGAALRDTKTTNFLNIGYKMPAFETTISFEGKSAKEASAYFVSQIGKYVMTPPKETKVIEQKPAGDPMDQLKKLSELKDAGIISDEEFHEKKKELLAKI